MATRRRRSRLELRDDGGIALLRVRRWTDRFRQSLFALPSLFVVGSVLLALATVELDRALGQDQLPAFLTTTVDSSRAILSTTAGGTIGAASVVFSLTLLAVQLASSQFSPRVLRGFLGDRFQQVVMGIVVGTFTYSLVVLRVVQTVGEESARNAFLPQISTMVDIVLAVVSLLAVLGSIDHTAKSLRLGSLLDRIADETIEVVESRYVHADAEDGEQSLVVEAPGIVPAAPRRSATPDPDRELAVPPEDALELRSTRAGWVTQVSVQALVESLPQGATMLLETAVGTYVSEGVLMGSVWPVDEGRDELTGRLRHAIEVRGSRTMQQDVAFGLLQLTDVALRALSPGVDDPNTANEAVIRIGSVLTVLLQHRTDSTSLTVDDRTLVLARGVGPADFVAAAAEPSRRYARTEPHVLGVLVRTLASARDTAQAVCDNAIDTAGVDEQLAAVAAELDHLTDPRDREHVRAVLAEVGSPAPTLLS